MIILGIDPGFEKLGYAFFELKKNPLKKYRYLKSGLIKSNSKEKIEKRLYFIYKNLLSIINKFKPEIIVFEKLFFFHNQKTAISVAQAQGIILLLAAQYNIKVEMLTPLQIKQVITGYGHSDKKAVQKMIFLTEKIPQTSQDDEIDAIACGLTYCHLH